MSDLTPRLAAALGAAYTITRELGAGGMARVFVARENALDREVVVKVLPPDLGAGINVERFRREIQLAAKLQHPHIVPVLTAGASDGLLFYTMPLIEGESLRTRLTRSGELPIGETIRLLRDVADALEYAHARGVVHRDIKPENILLSGHHAFVTDFGVAKALSVATGEVNLTSAGIALGTPTYMSPEQATGDPGTDHRTDLYSLGIVGYEMLCGRPPFTGLNLPQLLAAQATADPPPIVGHRSNVPPELAEVIERCLEKRPADRPQSAQELREQLEIAALDSGSARAATRGSARAASNSRRRIALTLTGVAAVILLASLLASRYITGSRDEFEFGETRQITNDPGIEVMPAISPDGQLIAYAGGVPARMGIFVRQAKGGGPAIRLADGRAPQWSPDGSRIFYVDSAGIAAVPALGGVPQRIVREGDVPLRSPALSHDGKRLAYSTALAMFVANADGSNARKIYDHPEAHEIMWSPDDTRLAFTQGNVTFFYGVQEFDNVAPSSVMILDLGGAGGDGDGVAVALTDNVHQSLNPVWSEDGDGVYYVSNVRGGRDVYYQEVKRARPSGEPRRLTNGLRIHAMSVGHGSLVYSVFNSGVGIWTLTTSGTSPVSVSAAHQLTGAAERIEAVRASPDGKTLAFDSDRSGNMDIYRMNPDGSGMQQLTTNSADEFRPVWSPDGRQIQFQSWRSGNRDLYVMAADGSSERLLVGGPSHEWAETWSPDGKEVAFTSDRGGGLHVWTAPTAGGQARKITTTDGSGPRWSPDGKWIAYIGARFASAGSAGAGSTLELVTPDGSETRRIVPEDVLGGITSIGGWSADSKTIYFRILSREGNYDIAQVGVDGTNPRVLVHFDRPDRVPYRSDFSTDGRNFYFTIGQHLADIWMMDLRKR